MKPLVKATNLSKTFKVGKKTLYATNNVNLSIYPGETLGLVGESGCGKSTIGKLLLQLHKPDGGDVTFEGRDLSQLKRGELKALRKQMQMIFQDPFASLNPRLTVGDLVGEPLDIHNLAKGTARRNRIIELLELVGLSSDHLSRFPHEFSGGQRQRIGIARALASNPKFIVCDEPISALDVSIQAQVINLLKELQQTMGLTYLLIAHDLAVVKYLSDRIAVMYLGEIMELATSESLFTHPQHPYTQALLSCIPIPNPREERKRSHIALPGDVPSPTTKSMGCPFAARCPLAMDKCRKEKPLLKAWKEGHEVACHLIPLGQT